MNFDISNKPIEWRIEPSDEEKEPFRFILKMGLETDTGYYIISNKSKIIFNRKGSDENGSFDCTPMKRYIENSDKYLEFYLPITLDVYREIEDLRIGNHLEVYLHIEEMLLISYIMPQRPTFKTGQSATKAYFDQYSNQRVNLLVKFDITKIPESKLLILQNDWAEKVIKPMGMGERIIIEIPCNLPELSNIAYDDGELEKLKNNLSRTIEKLKFTNDEYLAKRDHDACIQNLRGAAELLHKLPHNPEKPKHYPYIKSYKEFLFEKSGTGSKEISQEILVNIFNIIDSIFNISSKSVHEIESSSGSTFEYHPKKEDAELLLGAYSLVCSWITNKLERAALISQKSPYIDENLKSPLNWIKEHISSDDKIFSWWYFGCKISNYTKKDVCIPAPSERIKDILKKTWNSDQVGLSQNREAKDVADALLTTDPKETLEIMQTQDAKYIFIHRDDLSMLEEIFIAARKPLSSLNKINPEDSIKGTFMDMALKKEIPNGFELVYDDDYVVIYKAI